MRNIAVAFVIGLALVRHTHALHCQPCEETECHFPTYCKFGTVKGTCGCCDVCAQGQGQECGGPYGILGLCAKGLECEPTGYVNPLMPPQFQEGKCIPGLVNDQPQDLYEPTPAPTPAPIPAPKPQVKPAPVPAVVFKPSYGSSSARGIQPTFMRAPYRGGSSTLSGTFGRRKKLGLASPKAKSHKVSMTSSNIPPHILMLLQQRKMQKKMKNAETKDASSTSLRKKRSPRLHFRKAGGSRLRATAHKLNLSGMNIPQEVLERLKAKRSKRSPRLHFRKAGGSRLRATAHKLNLSGMNIPQEVLERLKAKRSKRSPRLHFRKAGGSRLRATAHKLDLSGMNIPQEVLERLKQRKTG